jgi:hypothetical protein
MPGRVSEGGLLNKRSGNLTVQIAGLRVLPCCIGHGPLVDFSERIAGAEADAAFAL